MPGQQMPATQAAPAVPAREDNAVCSIVLRISWHPVPDCEGYILIFEYCDDLWMVQMGSDSNSTW